VFSTRIKAVNAGKQTVVVNKLLRSAKTTQLHRWVYQAGRQVVTCARQSICLFSLFHSNILLFEHTVLTFLHTPAGRETKPAVSESHEDTCYFNSPTCLELATGSLIPLQWLAVTGSFFSYSWTISGLHQLSPLNVLMRLGLKEP
jgi:hypothetical protein